MSHEFLSDVNAEQIERGRDLNAQVNPFIQLVLNTIGDDPDTRERFKNSK